MLRGLESGVIDYSSFSAQDGGQARLDNKRPSLVCNPLEPYLRMQEAGAQMFADVVSILIPVAEQQLRTIEMTNEIVGMSAELQRFELLKYLEPSLYCGAPSTRGHKQIIMANGFSPYNPMTENVFVAPTMRFYQNMIPTLKSNAMLEPKRRWYERHGHNARFAFEGPNHIWYQNFIDTYHAASDALDTGEDVWIDGLSGGGLIGEMVVKKLGREGAAINLITNGSPEVNEEILRMFEESTEHPSIMGQVHKLAKMSALMDPDKEKMLEEIDKAAHGKFHPDSRVVRFYSNDDTVCPKPFDPDAIEVGGKHAVIPYRRRVLRTLQSLLADTQNEKLAA